MLTRALEQETDIGAALDLYARNRVDRTRKVVNGSDANRELFHLHDIEEMRRRFLTVTKVAIAMSGCIHTIHFQLN